MTRKLVRWQIGISAMLSFGASPGQAQSVSFAGHGGPVMRPGVVASTDPAAPLLTRIPDASLSSLFHVDPSYRRGAATGHIRVVGAFEVAEIGQQRVLAAWSPGFLPVTLSFSDGRCFALTADYTNGTLSNGRMVKVECGHRRYDSDIPPRPFSDRALRLIGSAWGYAAWVDDRAGITTITAPNARSFQPLFTARMATSAIMAMNSPDSPGGDVTLVGRIRGRLTVITLEVEY